MSISAAEIAAWKVSKPRPLGGNTSWAQRYGMDLRRVLEQHAAHNPRGLQTFLGPSELGVRCDRQVAGKMANLPSTNHVADPWPSYRGTALHAHAEKAFQLDNELLAQVGQARARWETERRVYPWPGHSGSADLYDHWWYSVDDHKFLGPTSMAKVQRPEGPPIHYQIQLLLYALGYRNEGYRVDRVVLIAWPAAAARLDGMYVWEHQLTASDDDLLAEVFERTRYRKQWAVAILAGDAHLMQVPSAPDDDDCYFCPFYRPQSAQDGGPGCPGTKGHRDELFHP